MVRTRVLGISPLQREHLSLFENEMLLRGVTAAGAVLDASRGVNGNSVMGGLQGLPPARRGQEWVTWGPFPYIPSRNPSRQRANDRQRLITHSFRRFAPAALAGRNSSRTSTVTSQVGVTGGFTSDGHASGREDVGRWEYELRLRQIDSPGARRRMSRAAAR
ncbi:hypothetical protein CDD83_7500 [Cordyceps sp. RAO-2017]|nr:hypothetical protein CDD83_7500 [Cordyceps sp. RAO-2017]